jgi:NitT/TauT family transport system substrate-binding protein
MLHRALLACAFILTGVFLAACGQAQAPAAPSTGANPVPKESAAKATASDQVSFLLEWVPHGSHAPFHLAEEKGFYRDVNLEVNIQDGSGSVKTVQIIGAGQHTVGFAGLSVMALGRGQNMPIKAVAGLMQRNVFGVFVPKDSGIKTPKDLEGKSVLVTPGSVETPLLPAFFAKNGVDPSKVKVVSVDAAAKVAEYIAGKTDAMITDVPYANPTIQPARPSDTLLWADYGLVLPAFGLFAREEVIQKNGPVLARFVQATLRGWDYSLANMDEAVDALMRRRPGMVKPEVAKQELVLYANFMSTPRTKGQPLGWQSDEDWKDALDLLRQYADLKAGGEATDYFTNQFVKQ